MCFKYLNSIFAAMLLITPLAYAQNCEPGEKALYKGLTEKKQVLICASPSKPPFQKIEYRFGTTEKVELTFTADKTNGKKFYASSEAINQRASLSYMGFNNGDTTYVIAECYGGGICPQFSELLIVAKGKKVIAKIKLIESKFSVDGITDFGKSSDSLIEVKDFLQFDILKAFGV